MWAKGMLGGMLAEQFGADDVARNSAGSLVVGRCRRRSRSGFCCCCRYTCRCAHFDAFPAGAAMAV